MLHIRLSNRHRPEWILKANIKGSFNNISHEWIVNNIPLEKEKLKQWLKAGHIEKTTFHRDIAGVSQGGTISPTISNMVLDKLSNHIEKAVKPYTTKKGNTLTKYNTKVTMIRYADDFVVTGSTKEILENVVKPAIIDFLFIRFFLKIFFEYKVKKNFQKKKGFKLK
jgi:RNA-directed DNA polymerase